MSTRHLPIQTYASGGASVLAALVGGLASGAAIALLLWHLL